MSSCIVNACFRYVSISNYGESNVISVNAFLLTVDTLQKLREIKSSLDEAISGDESAISDELDKLMEESIKMSYRSPFFDGLDRHDLSQLILV